ncbi:MAG: biotin/lipoyl-binding protein [Oscillospiraceae bacterium]|nr:biotin/lipoyl-binding protein [Oscillospiraceae bacterium]
MKKKGIRQYIPWIVLGLVALLLALLPTLARNAAVTAKATVLTAAAERGEIEETLAGGGTLTAEDAIEVKLPSGVEVTEFLVENGEHVEEGQALATVDRVSLMAAILSAQESLESVAEDLRDAAASASITSLTASAPGRVKAVYAQQGDDVRAVVLEHGALAVVSLDGMMKTEVEAARPVRAGEAVTVRMEDGSEYPGRVETELEGKITVTLTDDGPAHGAAVTVLNEAGEELGTGTLQPHSAWNVLATDGTVSRVYIQENRKVYSGSALFSIGELNGSAEYQSLAAKHGRYEERMQELFALYTDGTVRAECAGLISGIDDSLVKKTAAADREYRVTLLSAETPASTPSIPGFDPSMLDPEYLAMLPRVLVTAVNGTQVTGIPLSADSDLSSFSGLLKVLQGEAVPMDLSQTMLRIQGESFEYTPAAGDVVIVDNSAAPNVIVYESSVDLSGGSEEKPKPSGGSGGGLPNFPDMSGFDFSGLIGGFSFAMPSVGTQEEDELYDLEETVILSLTPENVMTVSISVDELDILRYSLGMKADVTVDALPDRSFSAEVVEIGAMGANSGGNSKYTVKLRLDRAPDMLNGMNASVIIHSDSHEALLIPAAAVHDRGSRSYVYAALDNKTGRPATEIPVTTGLSDGERVEILSGLEEGQPVFYEYYLPVETELP